MIYFITSYPRSGTTFFAKKLVKELGFYSVPESHFLHEIYQFLENSADGRISYKKYQKICNSSFKFRVWDVELPKYRYLDQSNLAEFFYQLVADYNDVSLESVKQGEIVDHTPENTFFVNQHEKYFINESRFIALIRDPRSLYNSIRKLKWGPNTPHYFCNHFLGYMYEIEKLKDKTNTTFICYESFVNDYQLEFDKLLENSSNYKRNSTKKFVLPKYTLSQHSLVSNEKADAKRVDAWRTELDEKSVYIIEKIVFSKNISLLNLYKASIESNQIYGYKPECIKENFIKLSNKLFRFFLERGS